MKSPCRHIFILLMMVGAATLAVAQQAPGVIPNTVYVGAEGRFEAAPDTAQLQFNIAPQEATAKAAYEHASRSVEQLRQLLRNNGIDPKSAEISYFSLAPVYDWRNPKRKLVGYTVTTAVTLKLKDFAKIAPLVQQLTDLDVTENQSLNYLLDDIEAAKAKAVKDAYQRARNMAEALAGASGRSLGELTYSSVDVAQSQPITVMGYTGGVRGRSAMEPSPTVAFTPQLITVTAQVNALFALK